MRDQWGYDRPPRRDTGAAVITAVFAAVLAAAAIAIVVSTAAGR